MDFDECQKNTVEHEMIPKQYKEYESINFLKYNMNYTYKK